MVDDIVVTKAPDTKQQEREACRRKGGTWNEQTQTCELREEAKPNQVEKGSEKIITKADGTKVVQTPETLAEDKRVMDVQQAQQQAATTSSPSARQAQKGAQQEAISQEQRDLNVVQTGVLDQTQPEFEELTIEKTGTLGENVPVIGPGLGALAASKENKELVKLAGLSPIEIEGMRQLRGDAYVEKILAAKASDAIAKQGLTDSERFGVFVEGIPLVGKLASNYVQGLDTPTGNIRDIRKNINQLREAAEFQATQAASGAVDPNDALDTILEMQDRVEEMEGRLKFLIQFSTVLRTSSDEVNNIETEIFRTKQKLFKAGQIAAGSVAQEPNPDSTFLALEALRDRQAA